MMSGLTTGLRVRLTWLMVGSAYLVRQSCAWTATLWMSALVPAGSLLASWVRLSSAVRSSVMPSV